ncbi:MAG: hypothetical protein SH857_18835 [Chitinophagales bacterium]|nr:hypothetical protein [Chitinophagales bacterium]
MLHGIQTIPAEAIGEFLTGIEDEIVAGRLTYEEQTPLLIAAMIGKSDSAYWQEQIVTPGAWANYLNADNAINYMHVNSWVSASMQGALLSYGLMRQPQIQLLDIITSMIGATGLVAGKVVWGCTSF